MFKLILLACLLAPLICRSEAGAYYTSDKGDSFYLESELKVSWYDALLKCSLRNMSLITPDTEEKQLEISDIISSFDLLELWTAGQEIQNLHFLWNTTGNNLTYSNWWDGGPKRIGSDSDPQCIGIYVNQWISYKCIHLRNFICEKTPIIKETNLELDALKANQRATNNQLEYSRPPLECDKLINLLDGKQREINDLKKENKQYLQQLSIAKAQIEIEAQLRKSK